MLSRTTVQHVTEAELQTERVQETFKSLDNGIDTHIVDLQPLHKQGADMLYSEDSDDPFLDDDDDGTPEAYNRDLLSGDNEETEDTSTTYDPYIGAEIILETGAEGSTRRGTVIKRARGDDGNLKGRRDINPYLSTAKYEVEMDGIRQEYTANQIAENIYSVSYTHLTLPTIYSV